MALVEIVVCSPEDAWAAKEGGADRLEVCAALETGGVTPSTGLVAECARVGVPLVTMLRPRPGGFAYSEREFATMLRDVPAHLEVGSSGFVVGLLREDRSIDAARVETLVAEAPDAEWVFHRAFDVAEGDLRDRLDTLIDCGVTRLLTSGGPGAAKDNYENLATLVEHARGRIQILAAGGVRDNNADELLRRSGVEQIHLAPVEPRDDPTGGMYGGYSRVSRAAVAKTVAIARGFSHANA